MVKDKRQLVEEIEYRIFGDTRIQPKKLRVQLRDSKAVLKGVVQSAAAKEAAESDVWAVKGIKGVENKLNVQFPQNYTTPSDETIRENLLQQFSLDPDLYQENISCRVEKGKIILEGTVGEFFRKHRAHLLAKQMGGVKEIKNNISVVPTRTIEDRGIANTITHHCHKILENKISSLSVEVQNGHVVLIGTLPDLQSFDTVEDIARYTDGVRDVINKTLITE
ncbi:Osmotically inducible protein Y [Chitinispirillum alkaliphilum]|nr:Osmotically inducible protein Y [Chitinispirillum alkaliphilum]